MLDFPGELRGELASEAKKICMRAVMRNDFRVKFT